MDENKERKYECIAVGENVRHIRDDFSKSNGEL